MDALTTENIREYFRPGDVVRDARGDMHSVFKVMHGGYGFTGVLLTLRNTGNGGVTYYLWIVSNGGRVRCTMTSEDFAATDRAFVARIAGLAQENGTETDPDIPEYESYEPQRFDDGSIVPEGGTA